MQCNSTRRSDEKFRPVAQVLSQGQHFNSAYVAYCHAPRRLVSNHESHDYTIFVVHEPQLVKTKMRSTFFYTAKKINELKITLTKN